MKYLLVLLLSFNCMAESKVEETSGNWVAPVFFGGVMLATIFNSGKTPKNTRNFWLLGAASAGFAMEDNLSRCMLATSLGMAAINHHYHKQSDPSSSEAGKANLIGAGLGLASPMVFESCQPAEKEQKEGLSFEPLPGETGLSINWTVRF